MRKEEITTCIDANYHKGLDNHGARTGVMEKLFLNQEKFNQFTQSDICQTIRVGGDTPMLIEPRAVLTPDRPDKRQNSRRMKEPGEPMFTLTAQDKHGVVIHSILDDRNGKFGETTEYKNGICPTILGTDYKGPKMVRELTEKKRIRKLTPLECFRLQSYPDWWYVTLKLFRHPEYIEQVDMERNDITAQVKAIIQENGLKEGMSDSQLYKMAGNGVTSDVAEDIGRRLLL